MKALMRRLSCAARRAFAPAPPDDRQAPPLDAEVASLVSARAEGRLIVTDYPYAPAQRDFMRGPSMRRLVGRLESELGAYAETARRFARHMDFFLQVPVKPSADPASTGPYWDNGWLPCFDGISLYGFVAERRPRFYVEVGSGNSTKFVRRAIDDHGLPTRIISIDPMPRAEIDAICHRVHRVPLEQFDLDFFDTLTAEDMLFVDNSHRALPNSDVTVFFLEVLGRLPKGMLYGLHDIFLPQDYPQEWASRYYSEQYLLAAYLFGGADGDQVALPNLFVSLRPEISTIFEPLWRATELGGTHRLGGAFWMIRGG